VSRRSKGGSDRWFLSLEKKVLEYRILGVWIMKEFVFQSRETRASDLRRKGSEPSDQG
jgi:hypothetical protein